MEIVIPRFRVGWMFITPEALVALGESQEDPRAFVSRHLAGDWGDVGPAEWAENEFAVKHGEPLFSIFHTRHGRKLRVVTDANRYVTTIRLPDEDSRKERSDS